MELSNSNSLLEVYNKPTKSKFRVTMSAMKTFLGISANAPKVYKANLTQVGTDAPEVTVVENTLGEIVWTRGNLGEYVATLNGAFSAEKTILHLNGGINADEGSAIV